MQNKLMIYERVKDGDEEKENLVLWCNNYMDAERAIKNRDDLKSKLLVMRFPGSRQTIEVDGNQRLLTR